MVEPCSRCCNHDAATDDCPYCDNCIESLVNYFWFQGYDATPEQIKSVAQSMHVDDSDVLEALIEKYGIEPCPNDPTPEELAAKVKEARILMGVLDV